MTVDLRGRSLTKDLDLEPAEFGYLVELAAELKQARRTGADRQLLAGRNIALIFEKTSTRTRCAFEVAAYDQGAHVTYLDPAGSQIGHKESIEDTARVLGRYYDGIEYRGSRQDYVEALAEHAGVPVWNGLTDDWHPTQTLCDILTMREHVAKPDAEIAFAFCGDARNNVGNSLLVAGALMGMDVRMVAPRSLLNHESVVEAARAIADRTGARITLTDDIAVGVRGADVLYTDVWVSMGEPKEIWDERIELLLPYQVNARMVEQTGNPAVRFMHCLPAFHDRGTTVGEELYERAGLSALEVTDDVFRSKNSDVFDQAENRMHAIKALMVATISG